MSLKNIVEQYLWYGYDPREIAEIEGIKIKTVNSYYKKLMDRVIFVRMANHRSWLDWERKPEHDHEDKYGEQPMPIYTWNELEFEEKRLYLKDNHSEMIIKYTKK